MQKNAKIPLAIMFLLFALINQTIAQATNSVSMGMPDELKIKPEQVFEFLSKPVITKTGDIVTISFTSKAYCDATVVIEESDNGSGNKIVRHLASGVLGVNAPLPFKKNSHEQTLIWDGKDDKGEYLDNKDALTIRVSLGLKPQYEKSLFWEPKKRVSSGGANWAAWTEDVIPVPTPEGVYVYDGNGVDHVRLFDHDGNYIRTIYPFPSTKIKEIKGLQWKDYPHGYSRPTKYGLNQTTFFANGGKNGYGFAQPVASAMAVHPMSSNGVVGRLALVKLNLNRLASDGSTGGLNINGPETWLTPKTKPYGSTDSARWCPYSATFSQDGKKLYLTGYNTQFNGFSGGGRRWFDVVTCLDYEGDEKVKTFVGSNEVDAGISTSVACDSRGNVYVSDYVNDCVNVYNKDAKLLKTFSVEKPTYLTINPKTGEIYIFSWFLNGQIWVTHPKMKTFRPDPILGTLSIYKSLDEPQLLVSYPLPRNIGKGGSRNDAWMDRFGGTQTRVAIDFYTETPTIWLAPIEGILLLQVKNGKLEINRDFKEDTAKSVKRISVNAGHQRLYVNSANQNLYVTQNEWWVGGGSFHNLIEIQPEKGKVNELPIPLKWAEDMTFDIDGVVYFRQVEPQHRVVRYDLKTWREIPWDYGEEGKDTTDILSGLMLPSAASGCYSQGGLSVSVKGHLAVACATKGPILTEDQKTRQNTKVNYGVVKPYEPQIYPGRNFVGLNGGCVHVWDKHGKMVIEDAVPGMSGIDGLGLDKEDNVYLLSNTPRVWNGQKHFNNISGTLLKVQPGKNKWLSNADCSVPLSESMKPKRSPDISGYTMSDVWIEGVDWMYGGVGNCSFKIATGCICWQQSRFTIDYFARSFVPETDQFSVAVLDSSGNLILRIGQYGNVDDGLPPEQMQHFVPKSGDPLLVSPSSRSIGGDEVALMQPSHVATLSDRYVYIGDVGNSRIVQVKLGYHTEEKLALKDVKK